MKGIEEVFGVKNINDFCQFNEIKKRISKQMEVRERW